MSKNLSDLIPKYAPFIFVVLLCSINIYMVTSKQKKKNPVPNKEFFEDLKAIPQITPLPKIEIVPEFIQVPEYRPRLDNSILSDIKSHVKYQPVNSGARHTQAHEIAHFIHSDLRKAYYNPSMLVNGFYGLDGRGVLIEEPKFLKSKINEFVPQNLRSHRWQIYFQGKSDWNDQPLYILDELTCYVLGGKVCVEDYKKGVYTGGWVDGVSGCLDFSIYTVALCLAVEKHDPDYWKNNLQFKSFVTWQLKQACDTFIEGREIDVFKWDKQDLLLKELLTSQEAEPYRQMLKNHFEGIWLEIPSKVSLENEQYKEYQTRVLILQNP
jgi:hypothetical protein